MLHYSSFNAHDCSDLSGFLISSVMKFSVSQPEYEYRAAYRASAMSPGFSLESLNESSKFCVLPVT